ncbi:CSP37 [Candida theae]|uniref:CSP37 n=1 Tax=Candida theae TaxID=1198502 RepID=A0AAD5FXM9_9ASCO|nr:CSP37 [Candida theae]KAI5955445.1 CSP37 [Candida theae]
MSAGKYLLGAAAIAGGVYYYDQNVERILPRKEHQQLAQQTAKVDQKAHEWNNKLTQKIEQGKKELDKKTNSITESVKESDTYQKLHQNKEDYRKSVKDAATPEDEKSIFKRGMQQYIDFVNCLGTNSVKTGETQISSAGALPEVKEKPIFGNWFGKSDVDEAKDKAEQKKDEWVSWGSKKTEQAKADAEHEKNKLFNWGSDKADEAKAEAERKKNEWSAWGNKKADQVKADAEKEKNSWFSWGNKKADEAQDKKDDLVSLANQKLDEASKEFNKQYDASVNELNRQYENLGKVFSSTKDQANESFQVQRQKAVQQYNEAYKKFQELSNDLANDPEKNKKLTKAQEDFGKSLEHLKSYGDDVYHDVKSKLSELFK